MPRKARIDAPGALHHIIARGIERREIFGDDQDRDDFLRFNRRHNRSGHLFQNRYKSILCQENVYLNELVRYIHLNPLRAGVVKTLGELEDYRYCGHGQLMGKFQNDWQETKSVLTLFANRVSTARGRYRTFLETGVAAGRRPDLLGGGLLRGTGGWQAVQGLRKDAARKKSDERILGDSEFVEEVLARAEEALHRKYELASRGVRIEAVMQGVSKLTGVPVEALTGTGKKREAVRARGLVCFWAVSELGISLTELAGRLGIAVSTVSGAVQRGEQYAKREKLRFEAILNVKK